MHLDDLPQLKEPGFKTRRLHSGSRTHRLKIRGAGEQKFLCVAAIRFIEPLARGHLYRLGGFE